MQNYNLRIKNIIPVFAILTICFIITGCSKETIEDIDPPVLIEFPAGEAKALTFTENGGSETITFTAHKAWSAAAIAASRVNESWYSINPTEGEAGNTTITITTNPNDTYEQRSVNIVITCDTKSETIHIQQPGAKKEFLEKERAALLAFYQATNGIYWRDEYGTVVNENWCSNKPVGEWYGVTTNNQGSVTELCITLGNLAGHLPAEIGDLENLTRLRLVGNPGIAGELPKEIGNCKNLQFLLVEETSITGTIPEEIYNCKELKVLALTDNKLSGSISPKIGELQNLITLGIARNSLSGELPKEIGNLQNLEFINLHGNKLTGTIPQEIGNCKNLKWFDLAGNQLNGHLTEALAGCADLLYLDLQTNQFTGDIPQSIMQNNRLWSYSWGSILYQNQFNTDNIIVPAPIFKVKDADGNTVDSAKEYEKNKLTIIYQWATWCPTVPETTAKINKLYERYKNDGLEIIGISHESEETLIEYESENNIAWRNILNYGDNVIRKGVYLHNIYSSDFELSECNLSSFPTIVYPSITIIDQHGTVVFSDIIHGFESYSQFIDEYFSNS